MKKNILIISDNACASVPYWRSSVPFAHLRKMGVDISCTYTSIETLAQQMGTDWFSLYAHDVVFIQRAYSKLHLQLVDMCMRNGIKIWTDHDDDLLRVPPDNTAHEHYATREVEDRVIRILAASDIVSVSTSNLKNHYEKYCYKAKNKVHILRNAIDPRMYKYRRPDERADKIRVLWRGSSHHQKDLWTHKDAIVRTMNKYKEVDFWFVGFKPWFILENAEHDNWHHAGYTDVLDYHKLLHGIRPDITMVPLHDYDFNHSKSNIAHIEGVMAGSAFTVCPKWEEWDVQGAWHYDGPDTFESALTGSIEAVKCYDSMKPNKTLTTELNQENWAEICLKYSLDTVNKIRMEIIENLEVMDKWPLEVDPTPHISNIPLNIKSGIEPMEL